MDLNGLERMGRRRFLETMAGAGVSATTLKYLDQNELRDIVNDPEEELPFVARIRTDGDGESNEPIYDTIDRDEWERRQAALDVRDRVSDKIDAHYEGETNVGFRRMKNSPIDFGVRVLLEEPNQDISRLEELLDTEMTGEVQDNHYQDIPVIIDKAEFENLNYQFTDFDPVPGGQRVSMSQDNAGTLMGKMSSNTHGDGWVTAGHVAEGYNSAYETIGQDNVEFLGDIEETINDGLIDCAFISEEQSSAAEISDENNANRELDIVGYFPDSAIENYVGDSSIEVSAQGPGTDGRKTGEIVGVDGSPIQVLEIDPVMEQGDSGGPIIYISDDEAWYCGAIKDRPGIFPSYTRGTTIETIMEEMDVDMP